MSEGHPSGHDDRLLHPKVISIVGLHDAGKTTVATQLIAYWREHGLRVGTIKHDGHADHANHDDWEKEGSDTHRHRASGAAFTMVTGGTSTLLRSTEDKDVHDVEALVRRLSEHARLLNQPLDVVLVEGYKTSALPKVVVLREDDERWLRDAKLSNVRAIVTRQMLSSATWVAGDGVQVYHESNLLDLCRELSNYLFHGGE